MSNQNAAKDTCCPQMRLGADCSEGLFEHEENVLALISRGTSFRDPYPAFYAAISA